MDFRREAAEADMILIGLGSELDEDLRSLNTEKEAEAAEMLQSSGYAWLLPAYRDYLREKAQGSRLRDGLRRLMEILDGKNYFIVSQAQNSLIRDMNRREGRLVMPCGGAFRKQCGQNCGSEDAEGSESCLELSKRDVEALRECCGQLNSWLRTEENGEEEEETANWAQDTCSEEVLRALQMIRQTSGTDKITRILRRRIPEDLLGRCPGCNCGMVLNNVQAALYDERGYLSDWQRYTKWLQGTVNRKLLVLELGVGMEYPGMIRIPFERVVFLNQKAKMYRIHGSLYQLNEKLREKGVEISENAIDWLTNL